MQYEIQWSVPCVQELRTTLGTIKKQAIYQAIAIVNASGQKEAIQKAKIRIWDKHYPNSQIKILTVTQIKED